MDAGSKRILESVVHETLHSQQFSRSSTQATFVLTDLLSRYLTLVTSTCANYAEHAGRHRINARDAVAALGDLGVDLEELSEYYTAEGRDMSRYAVHSQRRTEDLLEFNAALYSGLREDRQAFIPLTYGRIPDGLLFDEDEEDESGEESDVTSMEDEASKLAELSSPSWDSQELMEVDNYEDIVKDALSERVEESVPLRSTPPPLPLSPISNPANPHPRKRQRTDTWNPPPHIPSFMPPFPSDTPHPPVTPPPTDPSTNFGMSPLKVPGRLPSPIPELPPSSAADYLTPTPYSSSSLSSQPGWHLPSKPHNTPSLPSAPLALPQVQPALFGAYHYVLTHPPPPQVTAINPGRYKVALALVSQVDSSPRWEPASTLFASTAPNTPRVAPMPPSHPVPISQTTGKETKDGKDKEKSKDTEAEPKLPTAFPRPVGAVERIAPLISYQSTRIPGLARQLLPNSVHARSTRLGHPGVLSRGVQKLTYGPGVNAVWNSGSTPAATPAPQQGGKPNKDGTNGPDGKDGQSPKVLVDARMFATWNYEEKRYNEVLAVGRRSRMGSLHIGGGMGNGISLAGSLSRVRSQSKS